MKSRIWKCSFLLAFIMSAVQSVPGQTTTARLLNFEEPKRELGTIKKEDGPVKLYFRYTNISETPVVIKDIHSQCGACLNGKVNTKPLQPGGSRELDVTFDPEMKYGEFKVSLTVIASNGDYNKYSTLTVTGVVTSDVTIEDQRYKYPYSGAIRSDKRVVGMRLVEDKRKDVTRGLEMYNFSDKEAVVTFSHDSRFLAPREPVTIAPKEAVAVRFTLYPQKMPEGDFMIPVRVKIDGVPAEDIIEVQGKIETK